MIFNDVSVRTLSTVFENPRVPFDSSSAIDSSVQVSSVNLYIVGSHFHCSIHRSKRLRRMYQ